MLDCQLVPDLYLRNLVAFGRPARVVLRLKNRQADRWRLALLVVNLPPNPRLLVWLKRELGDLIGDRN